MDDFPESWPAPPAASTAPAGPSVLRFATGEPAPVRVSFTYRVAVCLVAGAMILLPLLYGAVILGALLGLVQQFRVGLDPAYWPVPGFTGVALRLAFYLLPVAGWSLLVAFLLKPLFAPARPPEEALVLQPADAPQLFALLVWLCRHLNAPIPGRVEVVAEVNASARFGGGGRGLWGHDLVLTLGLPLAAGLKLGQFAAVIAHECGHCSQGAARRASDLISRIHEWFHDLVHGRDAWDDALERAAAAGEGPLADAIFFTVRAGVAAVRVVLWGFLQVCGLLRSFLSRQMEFNADACAIQLVGSVAFLNTTRRVRQLGLGAREAERQQREKWKTQRRLFGPLPEFIVRCADEIPADTQDRQYRRLFRRTTGWQDTHPADAERLRRAAAAAAPGVFHAPGPATELFTDFPALSQRLTVAHYHRWCGPGFVPEALVPLEAPGARNAARAAGEAAAERYFHGALSPWRPLVPSADRAPAVREPAALAAAVDAARARLRAGRTEACALRAAWDHARERRLLAAQARGLLAAGLAFEPADYGVAELDLDEAEAAAQAALETAEAALAAGEATARTRLESALALLCLPQCAARIPDAVRRQEEAREWLWVLTRLEPALPELAPLRLATATLAALLRQRDQGGDNFRAVLEQLTADIQARVDRLQELTSVIAHPFPPRGGELMLSEHLRNRDYDPDPAEQILREGRSQEQKLRGVAAEVLGRLAQLAEQVEACLRTPPERPLNPPL